MADSLTYKFLLRAAEFGYHLEIGRVSDAQYEQLVDAMRNVDPELRRSACPSVPATLSLDASRGHVFYSETVPADMALAPMIKFDYLVGRSDGVPCRRNADAPSISNAKGFFDCAYNFKTGKCQCPFMSGVVGPIILPDLYQKQK